MTNSSKELQDELEEELLLGTQLEIEGELL